MAIVLGAHDKVSGSSSTGSKSITVSAGSALVAVWVSAAALDRTVTFSDDKSNSWAPTQLTAISTFDIAFGVAFNVAAGATNISFSSSGSDGYDFYVFEFTGNWGTGAATDGTADDSVNIGDTTPVGPSITPTSSSYVVIGALNCGGAAPGATSANCADASPATGWATIDEEESAAQVGSSVIYQVFTSSAARIPGWTVTNSLNIVCASFAIKEGDPPASGIPFITRLGAQRI